METEDFLRHVLPPTGNYMLAVFHRKRNSTKENPEFYIGPKSYPFTDISEMAKEAKRYSDTGNKTYYAMFSFLTQDSRIASNANESRVFAHDIDCGPGKPFKDYKEGLKYLGDYLQKMQLPLPLIVRSGNGLHVYWVMEKPVPRAKWIHVAKALKNSIPHDPITDKPMFDPAIPADASRILRPVGTRHHTAKQDVVVINKTIPDYVTFDQMEMILEAQAPPDNSRNKKVSSVLANMKAHTNLPPAEAGLVASNCAQIAWCINNPQHVPEPLWYGLLGVAAYCKNPDATAVAWSQGHPAFNHGDTINKMQQWKDATDAPATCDYFLQHRKNGCKGCALEGRNSTPCRTGVVTKAIEPEKIKTPMAVSSRAEIPKPYKVTKDGIKSVVDGVEFDICPFNIYPVGYGRQEGVDYETVRYHWQRKNVGWSELNFRQSYLNDKNKEFAGAIADQGIVFSTAMQVEYFRMFLRSYMDNLRDVTSTSDIQSSMGWKQNETQFLMGDTLFKKTDGGVVEEKLSSPMLVNHNSHYAYEAFGDADKWKALTNVYETRDLPMSIFGLAVGFSAPLMRILGLKPMAINLLGETGSGKTLAQLAAQSIYTRPQDVHMSAKSTINALYTRMAIHNDLPITIDEMGFMDRRAVPDFIYSINNGEDKARLDRTAKLMTPRTFKSSALMSGNMPLTGCLTSSGMDTDAQLMRLLELSVDRHPLFEKSKAFGTYIHEQLEENAGHASRVFIPYLLEEGKDRLTEAFKAHGSKFKAQYSVRFAGQERFWEDALVCKDLAMRMAYDLGLHDCDPAMGIEFCTSRIADIRETVSEAASDAFDIIGDFIREEAKHTLTVFHVGKDKGTTDINREPREGVTVRFDIYRKDFNTPANAGNAMFHLRAFKRWLGSKGADYRTITDALNKSNLITTPACGKAYLAKDSHGVKQAQDRVIGFDLDHDRLRGIIEDQDLTPETKSRNDLVVIK